MIETKNPRIDVEQLFALVQAEIEHLKSDGSREKSTKRVTDSAEESNNPYSWPQLSASLDIAQQNADAGSRVSTYLNYRKSIRWFVRGVGKLVLYFGRVITVPQRDFNNAILHALRITLNGIRDISRRSDELEHRVDRRFDDMAVQAAREMERLNKQIEDLQQRDREQDHLIGYLKSTLMMQERRVALFLDEARRCLPESFTQKQLQGFVVEKGHLLDSLYVTFEDKFRGTRKEIKNRLGVYLPLLKETGAGTKARPVLDIGCGRGEWLELLRENQVVARGVDINETLAGQCRERGLEVEIQDAFEYLRSLPDGCLGAVTGFHIIEHLPMEILLELYAEANRVLASGGVAIFETPNPQNLLVGACNFYADPTHKRPLYPETQQFFLEYRGLVRVELKYLHPHDSSARLPEEEAPELASRLNDLLSCARDYAVIGYKP